MYCPNCGSQVHDTSKFCVRCGTNLQGQTPIAGKVPLSVSAAPQVAPTSAAPGPSQATETIRPQDTLHNRYFIVKEFGGGGMGKVYLALDTQNFNRQCIVKEMLPYWTNPAEEAEAKRNFERECQLLAALSYPAGIPQIFDHFVEGDKLYMVMTLIEGEDLEKRMRRSSDGRLPEKEVIKFALQVCDILVYLAKRQPPVVHRDLKPANLIVDNNSGNVMLVDFGIAKATRAAAAIGGAINTASWQLLKSSPLGTAGYAPPEQYQGATEPRSDVYALGATMHHLLTGRDPQSGAAPFDFPPVRTFVPTLSEQIEQAVTHALAMDVRQRPTAEELKVELEAISQAQPAAAHGPFHFRSGEAANTIPELAQKAEARWSDGTYHLYQGHLEAWLRGQNRHDLATVAEGIRQRFPDQSAGLEEFLRAVNPHLQPPALAVNVVQFDFGSVTKGQVSELDLQISNRGRGYLYGTLKSTVPWLSVVPSSVGVLAGATQALKVRMDSRALQEGSTDSALALELDTNGGKQAIAAHVSVTWVPALAVTPKRLDFGNVPPGATVTRMLSVSNAGGGTLTGTLACDGGWFVLAAQQLSVPSGKKLDIQATVNTAGFGVGVYEGSVTVATGIGQVVVPARLGVTKPLYDLPSRATRWSIFAAFALLSALACSLTTALGTRGVLGLQPTNSLGVLYAQLLSRFALLTPDTRSLADLLGVGTLLGFGSIGLVAWLIARTQTRALDEIEDFYHGSYLEQEIAAKDFAGGRYLLITLFLAFAGIFVGLKFNYVTVGDWLGWGFVIAPFAGVLIGGGITIAGAQIRGLVNTQSRLSAFERVFFVATGMATWGAILGATRNGTIDWSTGVVWALMGLVFAADSLKVPARLQWILGMLRPGLLVAFFGYIFEMLALAAVFFFRNGRSYFVPVDGFYRVFPGPTDATQVIVDVVIALAILAGGFVGLAAVGDASVERFRVAKTIGLALVPAFLIGIAGIAVGAFVFMILTLGRGWSMGTFLATASVIAAGLAFFQRQAPLLQRGEDALKARLAVLLKNRPLPHWVDRGSLVALARDLTPAAIGGAALLMAMLEPLVLQVLFSLLILLLCVGALAVGGAIVLGVILLAARTQTRTT